MSTIAEIRQKAAKKLNILAQGTTIRDAVKTDLTEAYLEVYAMLDKIRLTDWDVDEEIPNEYVLPIRDLVAYSRVDEYSVPNDRYQRIVRDAKGDGSSQFPGAEAKIREMQASNVYRTPEAVYY